MEKHRFAQFLDAGEVNASQTGFLEGYPANGLQRRRQFNLEHIPTVDEGTFTNLGQGFGTLHLGNLVTG
jgi:hypothetical protein